MLAADDWNFQSIFPRIDWVIVGGESGPNARPCNVEWIRDIVRQCREANVPCFTKQCGANAWTPTMYPQSKWEHTPLIERTTVYGEGFAISTKHPNGGDPSEWPEDLRVQQFPTDSTGSTIR